MGETPFNLSFEMEVVILMEIEFSSLWVKNYNDPNNVELLQANLDLLEEVQEKAQMRLMAYQHRMA